jgi:hypothetical protein
MKISGQVRDYETYLWENFRVEISIFWFFTRPDIPAKGHCVTLAEEHGKYF